tara:strand:- start:275 stop:457 length:183 start_codon:yes stop_codon:yes gene_type:complete
MKWDLEFRKNGCEVYVSSVTDSIYVGDMYTNTPSHIKARNITHAKIIATALNNHYSEEEE